MTVAQAVHTIESVGGRVRLKGERIRYRIPHPTPEPVAEAGRGPASAQARGLGAAGVAVLSGGRAPVAPRVSRGRA